MTTKTILSASRRTDIPAFYMDRFMAGIDNGRFHVKNPFNRRVSTVPATPDDVHTIVFWSKDFGPFIDGDYGRRLEKMGYNLFFLFTVNSPSRILEPNISPLDTRIDQARALVKRFGAASVWWRFDPICFYTHGDSNIQGDNAAPQNNLGDFLDIARQMADLGIGRCITSFFNRYAKVTRRTKEIPGFSWVDPPFEKKIRVLRKMGEHLESMNISLYTCCENELTASLPDGSSVRSGGCISGRALRERFGGELSYRKDQGQRRDKGCECTVSRDIGCYDEHPCYHGCLYCYARPAGDTAR